MQRLKKRADFLHTARGVKWVAPAFVLQARLAAGISLPYTPQSQARLGFTASRRVGGAVVRNFARRRLKEAAARVFPGKARRAHDYVLIARQTTGARRFDSLIDDLEKALQKVHMRLDRLAARPRLPGNPAQSNLTGQPVSDPDL
ncbi:MAG: ribonuclease P protein component [Alphaproteobacteria bacterium]